MSRLLYHPLSTASTASPFDECAVQVAQTGPVRIVSPYIGVSYLERLIDIAGDWLLITDVEAWLSSLSFRARPRAWSFIRENLDCIHHCASIHAKLVLSDSLAMMGSANLTQTGILGRTELGILIDEPPMIKELQSWYSELWEQTAPPVIDEASAFIKWLDDEANTSTRQRQKVALSSEAQKVRAKLSVLPRVPAVTKEEAPLELAAVAQTLLVEDQRHFDSIEQAIAAMLDALASKGFTLGEAVQFIRAGYPSALVREIYFGILRHTTNHVRSVYSMDTISRLVLNNERFIQSDRPSAMDAISRFDQFLMYLIKHLSFEDPIELPSEVKVETETGVSCRDQDLLIFELLENDFLLLEDLPGCLPLYQLNPDFEWNGRYKLFERAQQAWRTLTQIEEATPRNKHTVTKAAATIALLPPLYRDNLKDVKDKFELRKLERFLRNSPPRKPSK